MFHRASLIMGPHGAALSNCIFTRLGTPLVEFHRLTPYSMPNSPLYILYSRLFQLHHWVVVDLETPAAQDGYQHVEAKHAVGAARAALEQEPDHHHAQSHRSQKSLLEYPSWLHASETVSDKPVSSLARSLISRKRSPGFRHTHVQVNSGLRTQEPQPGKSSAR
jgi:hypothetical protein